MTRHPGAAAATHRPRPKTFELLLILLRSGGRVLTRQELQHELWPDSFVEEANLSFQISTLRKALGSASDDRAAVTGHRSGDSPAVVGAYGCLDRE